jgi:hypothetical protein
MSTTYTNLTSTNFPDSIDDFDSFLDPEVEEIPLINQYYNFIELGTQDGLNSANQILIDNPSLIPKIVNAARLNQLRDGLIAVENYCRVITPYYATCSDGTSTTTARVATTTNGNFVLTTGSQVSVKFTYGNTASTAVTLNVDNTGAKTIYRSGTSATRYYWQAGEVITFVYDGTYWVMQGKSTASTTYYGVTKLETSSTSTSTGTALTPSSLNSFALNTVSGLPVYSTSATYAVGDKVRYGNSMYVCNTAITSGEGWNSAHWTVLPTLQEQIENISSNLDIYATCLTSASNSTKMATTTNGNLTLKTGVVVNVLFYHDNVSSNPSLNVDGTGDKDIVVVSNVTTIPFDYFWRSTEIVTFVYNGASWLMLGRAPATTSYYGITKLEDSTTSTSTSTALTPSALNNALNGLVAPLYSSNLTYSVGDRVRGSSNLLYRCNTAITTPEQWNASHWTVLPTLQEQFAGKFEAIYGTTTNSQLTQAYNAGLDIVLKYNDPDNLTHYYMAQLSRLIQGSGSNVWYFSCVDGTTLYTFSCSPSSVWSVTKKTITTT